MSFNYEYLIEQLELESPPRIKLNFDHPIRELIWKKKSEVYKRNYRNFKIIEDFQLALEIKEGKKITGTSLYYFYMYFNRLK